MAACVPEELSDFDSDEDLVMNNIHFDKEYTFISCIFNLILGFLEIGENQLIYGAYILCICLKKIVTLA